jgi:hypothetical protein
LAPSSEEEKKKKKKTKKKKKKKAAAKLSLEKNYLHILKLYRSLKRSEKKMAKKWLNVY